jgi:hypothetical protein
MPMSPSQVEPKSQPRLVPNGPFACPLCNGRTIPVRDLLRCCVCGFTTCAGCQGDTAENCCEPE